MNLPLPLERPFRLLAFDWDGTAVENRAADAMPVRGPIERLLRCGVLVVVITGTNVRNVHGQLVRTMPMRGRHLRNLFLATNRGSEVYGFDDGSALTLLRKRTATPDEERALTEIADAVRDDLVRRSGLEVGVVYDRLNRRKVDLIPVEKWRDPPKSGIGDLLSAVETRLRAAGIRGGVREVLDLAGEIARAKGLTDARITSDVKHVEIGLTDKADSVRWVLRELAGPRGIPTHDVLIGGDEFGPIAGFEGSDNRMLVPEIAGATIVSVGPEPGGAPRGVVHLGGGPPRFRELLASQAALHPVGLPRKPEEDPRWLLVEDGFVVAREHEIESLFAIGNGFVGSRGSLAEGSPMSAPATFVAGVFENEPGSVPALAPAPEWIRVAARLNGTILRLDSGEILEHRRTLDLRQAILWRHWRQRDPDGRITRIEGLRLASLADRRLLLQSITMTPENYGGVVTVEAPSLSRTSPVRTLAGVSVNLVAESRIEDPEGSWTLPPPDREGAAPQRWQIDVDVGKTYRLDRIVAVHSSRDGTPLESARERLRRASERGFDAALDAHIAAWRERWDAADVVIDGDDEAQAGLRFALYHLMSAANPEDERVSIGARSLTGAAYKGHVFWDTEIFMLPFFTLTWPEAARALLMYRHHTLPAARARAARFGHRGALYAWESADSGEDVTPAFVIAPNGEVLHVRVGEQEQHISADVAFGVWRYWEATHDEAFLRGAGAEILFETARFWASRARREDDGWRHIRRVIGPDEYHEGVDDNAYTNGMAKWNLETAAEAAAILEERWPERLRQLGVGAAEAGDWLRAAEDMYTGFDPATRLFEQFRGFFDLEDVDHARFETTLPIDLLMGRERTQRCKIIKQADVVMLVHLLWDRFPAEVREANFRYYEPRTSHGSSLSPPIHAAVAARLGHAALAEKYFRQTLEIDLANRMGNAAGGVHMAALGGMWQAVVHGFAGLSLGEDGPTVHPRLPAAWRGLRFAIRWLGRRIPFDLRREAAAVEAHA